MSLKVAGERWEEALAGRLGWSRSADAGIDLVRADGLHVIETKYSLQGARDLHAAVMQLALYIKDRSEVVRGTLVARVLRMNSGRVLSEWTKATSILRPDVSRRLTLVAIAPDRVVVFPDDAETKQISEHVRQIESVASRPTAEGSGAGWSRKSYEIWKVLLGAWLRREAPLPLQEIERRSGASYPTVSTVLDRLETLGELRRTSNRSAALTGPPRRSLGEILALGAALRETHRYVDRSGRPPNARDLIRRIRTKAPDAALGGVEAARHYVPDFDLNGYPRIDVTIGADVELTWVKTVDPALAEASPPDSSAVRLVVHRLLRREPDFTRTRQGTFADPAEVVLDLHELRLVEQADDFVNALREGGGQ